MAHEKYVTEFEDKDGVVYGVMDEEAREEIGALEEDVAAKAPVIINDASGNIVTITDGAEGMPLSSCVVQIDPVQAGEGDPSPENVRPLFGSDGCTIHLSGKNLVKLTADMIVPRPWDTTKNAIRVDLPAGTFTARFNSDTVNTYVYGFLYDRSGTVRLSEDSIKFSTTTANGWNTRTFTLPDGGRLYIYKGSNNATWTYAELIAKNFQLELGSTMSATYIPYSGQTYSVDWQTAAGAVYGGTLDTRTGVLTVTHKEVDLGSLTWTAVACNGSSTKYYMRSTLADCKEAESNSVIGDVICERYKATSFNVVYGGNTDLRIALSASNHRICVYDSAYNTDSSASAFKTAMDGVKAVYGLKTPLIYQLDPVQITALRESNIWADTGAVSLTYPADTQTYVDGAISAATDPDGNVIQVTGSTPSITGESGKRYVCGTVDSISITPPQTGIIDVVFASGTTPTVLTVPSGVKFPGWFNPSSLDASTVYEINIQDGVYGVVMAWPI